MKNSFIYEAFHDREKALRCFYSKDATPSPHFHRCIEMLYITRGKAEGVVDGRNIFAEKDDIVFARKCAVHSYLPCPHYGKLVLIVKEAYEDDFAPYLETGTLPPLMSDKAFNRTLFSDFLRLYRVRESESFLVKKGLINIIFGKLFSHYPREKATPSPNLSTIVSVLGYIDDHFEEQITLDSIAAEFGYNKYYFSRLFNTYIGDSLNGYINMVRVNNVLARAKKKESGSLSQIIFDCGFDSMTTFYRNYSRFYDKPPTEILRTEF